MRKLRTAALALLLVAIPAAAELDVSARRDAAERARASVRERLDASERGLRARVRALYKLSAFGDLPHWVDENARDGTLHRRGAARRVILRDLEERRILREELTALDGDLARIQEEAGAEAELGAARPRAGTFDRPVTGRIVALYGPYDDGPVHLLRRGVELAAREPAVITLAAGRVTFTGAVRGLGLTVIVDHGDGLTSITGRLGSIYVHGGESVARGQLVGQAAGARIYLEIRRAGRPIDPAPLIRESRQL